MFQMWQEGSHHPKLLGMSGATGENDDERRLEEDGGRGEAEERPGGEHS